jgi:long-chain fatty acid transport protein
LTDWLSIGGGPLITYGRLDLELRAPLPLLGEPKVKLDDLTDWAVAPFVSVLLEPTERLRFGVLYMGETDLNLDGDLKIPVGAGTPGINLDLPLAQAVRTSIYWEVNDTVALMMNSGWEDWSTAKELPISAGAISADVPLNFRDTWYLGAGIHYKVGDKWTLQAGFRYDSSALKDSDRTVAFPVDQILTAGVGAKYDWSEKLQIGFHFGYTDLGKSRVNQPGIVKGKYRHNDLYLFGVTLNWKKLPWSGRGTF